MDYSFCKKTFNSPKQDPPEQTASILDGFRPPLFSNAFKIMNERKEKNRTLKYSRRDLSIVWVFDFCCSQVRECFLIPLYIFFLNTKQIHKWYNVNVSTERTRNKKYYLALFRKTQHCLFHWIASTYMPVLLVEIVLCNVSVRYPWHH